ncbi:hypothetical protein AHAS_Ahas20G0123500 [Arachis hypogaea]
MAEPIGYGGLRYEISVSCMSSFLEVKKVLSVEMGLQMSAIDKSISNGDTAPEIQILTLIEMFIRQAIKLKSISREDVSAQESV